MKEKEMVREIEIDAGMEMIDLGNAMEETRQWNPLQTVQDSPTSWGLPFSE